MIFLLIFKIREITTQKLIKKYILFYLQKMKLNIHGFSSKANYYNAYLKWLSYSYLLLQGKKIINFHTSHPRRINENINKPNWET
jgi:hypothetical protein